MSFLAQLRIRGKIYLIVAVLAIAAILTSLVSALQLRSFNTQVSFIERAAQATQIGEQVNATILAVVMDSRGIYMARDAAEVEKFGKPLVAALDRLDTLMDQWRDVLPAGKEGAFASAAARVADFRQRRLELVRLGKEEGAASARTFGDNDENRQSRQALNKAIQELAAANAEAVTAAAKGVADAYSMGLAAIGATTLLGIVVALVVARFVANREISTPIRGIQNCMTAMAEGHLDVEVPCRAKSDEVGEMARSLEVFRTGLCRARELAAEQEASHQERARRAETMETIIRRFDAAAGGMLGAVAEAAGSMGRIADDMTALAERTNQEATSSSLAAGETSANVQTVAAASEEMVASIQEISRQIEHNSRIAEEAVQQAEQTGTTVNSLSQAVERIGAVVQLISDIASQTNLLALNATIEAARAGDAGKGFAVVAGEVKALANQTARATEEIAQQITGVQAATRGTVDAIGTVGRTISSIREVSAAIAAAIEEQNATTAEITRSVQQAALGTEQVSNSVASVKMAAGQSGDAARQVLQSATELTGRSDQLKCEVERFLGAIRAA